MFMWVLQRAIKRYRWLLQRAVILEVVDNDAALKEEFLPVQHLFAYFSKYEGVDFMAFELICDLYAGVGPFRDRVTPWLSIPEPQLAPYRPDMLPCHYI